MAVPGAVREHYLKEIGGLIERYRRELGASGIDYQLLTPTSRSSSRCCRISRRGREDALADAVLPLAACSLAGAAAAAVPIVLHLLKREPEARVKFAAVKLLKQAPVEHTDRRHLRELLLLALRVAALRAAGARVCAAVLRDRRGGRLDRRHRRRARHVVQPVGARPLRAREAAGEGRDCAGAGRRPRRRRDVRRRGGDRRRSRRPIARWPPRRSSRRRAGFGATRYRAALSAASQASRPAAAARSSSSPICRRAAGTPATARRCRRRRRSRSPTSARCRRTWRSPRCGRWPIASSPPFATPARARATRACT